MEWPIHRILQPHVFLGLSHHVGSVIQMFWRAYVASVQCCRCSEAAQSFTLSFKGAFQDAWSVLGMGFSTLESPLKYGLNLWADSLSPQHRSHQSPLVSILSRQNEVAIPGSRCGTGPWKSPNLKLANLLPLNFFCQIRSEVMVWFFSSFVNEWMNEWGYNASWIWVEGSHQLLLCILKQDVLVLAWDYKWL